MINPDIFDKGTCVVAKANRMEFDIKVIIDLLLWQIPEMCSVWPKNPMPDRLMMFLCTGAVIRPLNSPDRQPKVACSIMSTT